MKNPILVISLAILLGFAFGCQNKAEKAELEKFRAQAKVEEQNKELVRNFFSAIDKSDFAKIQELSAAEFGFRAPGLPGPIAVEGIIQAIKVHYTAFPDWKHTVEDLVADGDKVAVRLAQTGTHKAEYEGIPATGKDISMPAICLLVIANGKVKEVWAVENYWDFYQQLGMELKPKEAEKK